MKYDNFCVVRIINIEADNEAKILLGRPFFEKYLVIFDKVNLKIGIGI
jgi:hypothetical protein